PRHWEVSVSVDSTDHAAYFQQAANALCVRQALLSLVLGKVAGGNL
ncbi:MAG: aspartate carbamoyltransferase, partial [Nitrosomonas sp.]